MKNFHDIYKEFIGITQLILV